MLVACRLAGLSALGANYAGINVRPQCEYVRKHVGAEERRRLRQSESPQRALPRMQSLTLFPPIATWSEPAGAGRADSAT